MESWAQPQEPLEEAAEVLYPKDRHGEADDEDDYAENAQGSGGPRCGSGKEERHAEDKAAACPNVQPDGDLKDSGDADKCFRVDEAHGTNSG